MHILEPLHGEDHHRHLLSVLGEQHLHIRVIGRGRVLEQKLVAQAQLHLKQTWEEKSKPNPPEHRPKSSAKSLTDGSGAVAEIAPATLLAGLAGSEMAGDLDPVLRQLGGVFSPLMWRGNNRNRGRRAAATREKEELSGMEMKCPPTNYSQVF